MLLLRLFLLMMMMIIGDSRADDPMVYPANCDTMACFAHPRCKERGSVSKDLEHIKANIQVFDFCDAVAKIRSYSTKYYFIELESYDIRILWIQIEQGATTLRCEKNAGKVSVMYKYNDAATAKDISEKMIEHRSDKLMCKFFVRNDAGDVFESRESLTKKVKLSSSFETEGATIDGIIFHRHCNPTCDPYAVQNGPVGVVGDKFVSKVDVQLANLVCPAGQTLMYRTNDAPDFKSVKKISCMQKQDETFEFDPMLKEARCEVPICSMCSAHDAPPILEKVVQGVCTTLKCATGRLKIGTAPPVDGSLECKSAASSFAWQINGQPITFSDVSCAEIRTCAVDGMALCSDCVKDSQGIPTCPGGQLKWKALVVDKISCDDSSGLLTIHLGTAINKRNDLPGKDKEKIVDCVGGPHDTTAAGKVATGGQSGDNNTAIAIGSILGVLVVGGLIGGAVYYFRRRAQKAKQPVLPQTARPNSKESKSVNSKESKKPTDPKNGMLNLNEADMNPAQRAERNRDQTQEVNWLNSPRPPTMIGFDDSTTGIEQHPPDEERVCVDQTTGGGIRITNMTIHRPKVGTA